MKAPVRTDEEARSILAAELRRLEPRRSALSEADAHAVAGWTLQNAMEWEAARMAWTRAATLRPDDVEARFCAAVCLLELSRFGDAAAEFRDVLDADARAAAEGREALDWMEHDPAYRLGTALHAAGRIEEAIAAYDESAERNSVGTDALREMARCRLALRDASGALAALARLERRAVRLSVRAEVMALRADAEAMLRGAPRR